MRSAGTPHKAGTRDDLSDFEMDELATALENYIKMPFNEIQTGSVATYQYLWLCESLSGQTAGRKERPVVVGIRLSRNKSDFVYFLPITTLPPRQDTIAIEVPQIERKRAGLDADRQQ